MKSFRTALLSLSAALAACAASAYTSVNVPGTLFAGGDWSADDASQRLVAMSGNPHVWTNVLATKAASGQIKFAADGSWDVNWGGDAPVTNFPATDVGPLSRGGNDITVSNLVSGASLAVAFDDRTATFSLFEPVEIPSSPVSVQLVGEFNSWGDDDAGFLSDNGDGTWSATGLDLDPLETAYLLRIATATATNDFGQPVSGSSFAVATNATASVAVFGPLAFGLTGDRGGEFTVTFDTAARTLSFAQTKVASGDATVVLSGNFIGSGSVNMIEVASKRWRSEHFLTADNTNAFGGILTFTLSRVDAEGTVEKRWSAASAAVSNMQGNANTTISGTLVTTDGEAVPLSARTPPGRYLLYFNERTGAYTFARRYNASEAVLKNAGLESVWTDDNGTDRPSDWSTWSDAHANAVTVSSADGYPVHAGEKAVLLRRLFGDWESYAGLSQDIGVAQYAANGLSIAVSGYFRQQGNISFSTGGILVEMFDSSGNNLGAVQASASEFSTASWTYLSCVAAVPSNAVTAHVSCRLDNISSYGGGGVLVDDPEVKLAGTQTQNFNAWGSLASFARRELDWYASSAKTTNNVSTAVSVYGDLIISQVVEGSDNNKAVELYNGTAASINLNGYTLVQYDNGATEPTAAIALSGTIPSKEAFVVSRPANHDPVTCSPAITALADFTSDKLTFNGDDVLMLKKGTQVIDVFGTVSADASASYWAAMARDATATRKSSVTNASAAFSLSEWTFSGTDDVSGLGSHSFDGDQAPSAYVPSGYSCILNTNAFLKTSELANGAGSASFHALCEPPGQSVDVIVQTSSSYEADLDPANATWRSVATNTIQPGSDWQFFATDISSSSALFVRFLSANGSSAQARARLDDIALDDYSAVRRYQYFTDWNYPAAGTYTKAGWTLANGSISVTNGEGGSRCALLADGTSSLTSPFFEGGVGDTTFFARVDPEYGEATVTLKMLVSTDRGETWEDTGSRATVGAAATNLTLFAYCASNSAVRIACEDEGSDVPVFLDSVYVASGILRPSQDFEEWTAASYGDHGHQGWMMTDGLVNATNGVDESRCGSMIDTVSKHATIRCSYLPDIVGGRYSARREKKTSPTKNHEILVQASGNGTDWTTVATHNVTNFSYETFFFQLPADATWHFVRFFHNAGSARTDFDDILLYQPGDTASVSISAALSPAYLTSETTALVTGTVIPENTAEILSVEGLCTVNGVEQPALAMDNPSFGDYESQGRIGPFETGTRVAYAVRATYAGHDADGSGAYSTNTVTSAWKTNTITAVAEGSVWINEINAVSVTDGTYVDEFEFDFDTGDWIGGEMHEYIELCGLTNVDVSGWTVELRAGRAGDIIKLGGDPTYARYVIPDGTVLGQGDTIPTADGSHALLLIGDKQLLETKHGLKVALDLSSFVPAAINPNAETEDDNIFAMAAGVVALLDAGGNTVDAVAYNGFDSTGVAPTTSSQSNLGDTESISLGGTGSLAGAFDWDKTSLTPGAVNAAQTLEAVSTNLLAANLWHTPSLRVVPRQAQYAFTMRSPLGAAMTDAIDVTFGWDADSSVSLQGVPMTLFYRSTNAAVHASGGWQSVAMAMRDSFDDRAGNHYYAGTIPAYAYPRCSEIEYYIFVQPAGDRYGPSWLGADATGEASTNYTATTVQEHPFRFSLAFEDQVYLGLPEEDAYGNVVFDIGNNDTVYPITNFLVRSAPSILTPADEWATNEIAAFLLDTAEGTGHFEVVPDPALADGNAFYRLDLIWP